MIPLLVLELRRQRSMMLRMGGLTVLVALVFFVAGKRTPTDQLAALIGSGLGVVLIVPMGIARDRMEGTLEFICGLPVEPRVIAASRFIAAAALVSPWAIAIGGLSVAVPAVGALNAVDVTVLAWLALFLLAACATALFAQFDLESLLGAPTVVMVILVVVVPRLARALIPGITPEMLLRLLSRPIAPLVLVSTLVLGVAALGVIAFRVTVHGFTR